ncbi:PadR family transcriptional regulator [Actinobacteria bacterium YIM 96077]|uniref:PadR family transcriptional regulator n=1 Tax=Phytoactinopolyspora halophila TaxID=1981511 RepID=A0A329QDK5_9ACTN|nr:PadR family transcriptional regulator [Phytoactinopolyspora halophila]AYY12461.1 PadR family transcriptional regulator [Actinobacteria bacterium YIM 96077]RAW09342.1 PadR family transcriptional regulator [Phytoactinopolyspora halophila]
MPRESSEFQDLPPTSYALLGLLSFGPELTGYELKQWADSTLGFYWVAPAMSQVYTELTRLDRLGLVESREDSRAGRRPARRYKISTAGLTELRRWLTETPIEFPVLKHPAALRLLLGHLVDVDVTRQMLDGYLRQLDERRAALQQVRDNLGADAQYRFPAEVAEWGLAYYDFEARTAAEIASRLADADPPTADHEQ